MSGRRSKVGGAAESGFFDDRLVRLDECAAHGGVLPVATSCVIGARLAGGGLVDMNDRVVGGALGARTCNSLHLGIGVSSVRGDYHKDRYGSEEKRIATTHRGLRDCR